MDFSFSGEIWYWRGPSPFHFVTVPEEESSALHALPPSASYGWGVIPVRAVIGSTSFTTSLFPKDGGYQVPVKAAVRKAERIELGDVVVVRLSVDL